MPAPRRQEQSRRFSIHQWIAVTALAGFIYISLTNSDALLSTNSFLDAEGVGGAGSGSLSWAEEQEYAAVQARILGEEGEDDDDDDYDGEGGDEDDDDTVLLSPEAVGVHHVVPPSAELPYFMQGRSVRVIKPTESRLKDKRHLKEYKSTDADYDELETLKALEDASIDPIPSHQHNWVLPDKLDHPTRNHDNIIFDVEPSGRQLLLVMLGRYSKVIQWVDLLTGKQNHTLVTGKDPAGNPLSSLNHVYSVVVDSLTTPSHKEVWLPCGFHGHKVNDEWSSEYVRVVDLQTMQVKTGPKLPFAGGACVAGPIHVKGPDHPAHVCVFGGTHGEHDRGTFLPYTSCYDRVEKKWHHPFGRMPFGFDHGNLVHLPSGVCAPDDPERLLLFNFRTEPYGTPHSEIMAYDIPTTPWSSEDLNSLDAETPGSWYTYANISYSLRDDEVNAPRDASGLAIANNWRNVINFGGVHYFQHKFYTQKDGTRRLLKKKHRKYSTVRSLDVCDKEWTKIGDMGMRTFALQTSVSAKMNLAITCGGQSFAAHRQNSPWCLVNRIPGMQFQSNRGSTVTEEQIPGMVFSEQS